MNIRNAVRYEIWDYILCTALTFAAGQMICYGFFVKPSVISSVFPVLAAAAIITAVLFAVKYNRKSLVTGIIAIVVIAGIIFAVSAAKGGVLLIDKESNPFLFIVITFLISTGVVLLSRTRTGICIIFAAVSVIFAGIWFLYEKGNAVYLIIALIASGMLLAYRTYEVNASKYHTVKFRTGQMISASLAVMLIITAIGCGIFYGIVKPLDPGTKELKLITNRMAFEVIEKTGIANTTTSYDPDMTGSRDNNRDKPAADNKDKDKKDDKEKDHNEKKESNNAFADLLKATGAKLWYLISYVFRNIPVWLYPIIVAAVIALVVYIKKLLRKRRFGRMCEKGRGEAVIAMYNFYLRSFGRMGIARNSRETPFEFAKTKMTVLSVFRYEDTDFSTLTDIYVKAGYGNMPVSDDEYNCYLNFYQDFYKCCLNHLGKIKYIFKFFIL